MKPLTPTQEKVLRAVAKAPNGHRQLAGHGMAPYLSAAHALVRKGLLRNASQTGNFYVAEAGYTYLAGMP